MCKSRPQRRMAPGRLASRFCVSSRSLDRQGRSGLLPIDKLSDLHAVIGQDLEHWVVCRAGELENNSNDPMDQAVPVRMGTDAGSADAES